MRRPPTRPACSKCPGQVPAGSVAMVVANVAPFESGGGWAVIGNGEQVIRYTAKSGNSLLGIPGAGVGAIIAGVAYNSTVTAAPMLTGVPASGARSITQALTAGDEIYLVVQRRRRRAPGGRRRHGERWPRHSRRVGAGSAAVDHRGARARRRHPRAAPARGRDDHLPLSGSAHGVGQNDHGQSAGADERVAARSRFSR